MPIVVVTLLWILFQWLFVIFLVPTGDIRTRWAPDSVYRVTDLAEDTKAANIMHPDDNYIVN